jgi:hypothetical protein
MNEVSETLEIMRILDSTVEYGDCILWNGAVTTTGHGIYKKYGCGCKLVRREMYALTKGDLIPREPIDTICGERLCLNPAHLIRSTISRIALKAGALGAWSKKTRCAKIAHTKRKSAKLTIEIAREIRLSQDTGPVLAKRFGVNRSLVNNIKRGLAWRDYSNPFSGLMA